ncbi:MAG: glycosyltransferase family 39 protein [Candidatus Binatia bacterium]
MSSGPTPIIPASTRGALPLALVGLASAAAAQLLIPQQPWLSVGAFVLAASVFGTSARGAAWPPESAVAVPPPLPRASMALFASGIVLCSAAGALVYLHHRPLLTHVVWACGLAALALGAGAAPHRTASTPAPLSARERAALIAVLAFAAVLFCWELTTSPAEVHGDDAEVGLDAARLLSDFNLFAPGWFELPRFHAFWKAVGLQLFGINLLGLRATSAALGLAAVGLLFLIARRLWGTDVALLAAVLLASQRFFLHLSRAGYIYIDTPALSLLVVWLFLRVWQDGRIGAAVLCGVALGLGVQTYYASRLVPILLALTWLTWLLRTARGTWRAHAWAFALIAITALAVSAPMFGFALHDWSDFWKRTRDTSVFAAAAHRHLAAGYGTDDTLTILAIQLRAALTVFNRTGDTSLQYGLREPLFDDISAALFVLGFGVVATRLRERRAQLAFIWLVVPLIAGAALTVDTPFYPRISGIVPFAVLLVALAFAHLLRRLRAAARGPIGQWAAAAACAAGLTLIVADNALSYFVEYAPRHRHSPAVEIAQFVRRHGAGKTTYMVGGAPGFYIKHGSISFLTWGEQTRDVIDLDQFLRQEPPDPGRSAFVVMPAGEALIARLQAAVGPLDVQVHHDKHGGIAFFSAVPRSAGDALDPPEWLAQSAEPGPGGRALATALAVIRNIAVGVLAVSGVAGLLLAVATWWKDPRQPPRLGALRPPLRVRLADWGARLARWRERAAGPDARERAAELPPRVTAALLALIVLGALAVRVYALGDLPAGFYCDEAGNGYNAYALLHTGRDETGTRWPLYVWSFGVSYKNPVFIYSAALPMALLGPSEFAVRLTAALWGTATVLALFFLGRALIGSLGGLAAALLLAICPWHVHFSRIAYELIALPFFFTVALTCLVRWARGWRTLGAAAVLLGLCLYTYAPAKLFVPLFLAGFALLYHRQLWRRRRESLVAAALLVLTAAPVLIFDATHAGRAGAYFAATALGSAGEPPLELVRRFAAHYAAFFSIPFLFEASNDPVVRHAVRDHGELYPFFLPLLGAAAVLTLLRRDRALLLPVLWLALYPVAAALMNEIPSASRGILGAAAFCVVAGIGAAGVLRLPAVLIRRVRVAWAVQALLVIAGLAALAPAARGYWHLYRDAYPRYSATGYDGFQFGHRRVVEVFRERYDEFDQLVLSSRFNNQPQSFLEFYDGLRQPPRAAGRPFRARDKMVVGSAEQLAQYVPPGRRLFAVLPDETRVFGDGEVIERVIAPNGKTAFVLVAATSMNDFISTWYVNGPLPARDNSPPPQWDADAPPQGDDGKHWQLYQQPFAATLLNDFFTSNAEHACAWAVNFVSSDAERDVRAFAGFDDTGEVWLNGERVALQPAGPLTGAVIDRQTAQLHLHAGRNTIAIRSCETVGDWRFYFRLENLDRTPVQGLTWAYGPQRRPG